MIIWSGLGFLVPLIAIVCLAIADKLNLPESAALLVAAVIVFVLGLHFRNQPGRTMIDKATGQEVILRRNDSVFFIPVVYWGIILALFGIYYLFAKV